MTFVSLGLVNMSILLGDSTTTVRALFLFIAFDLRQR